MVNTWSYLNSFCSKAPSKLVRSIRQTTLTSKISSISTVETRPFWPCNTFVLSSRFLDLRAKRTRQALRSIIFNFKYSYQPKNAKTKNKNKKLRVVGTLSKLVMVNTWSYLNSLCSKAPSKLVRSIRQTTLTSKISSISTVETRPFWPCNTFVLSSRFAGKENSLGAKVDYFQSQIQLSTRNAKKIMCHRYFKPIK